MPGPAQVEGPAACRGKIDIRRTWALSKVHGGGPAGAVEGGPDPERSTRLHAEPRHPEDLIRPVGKRRRVQRVTISPQDGDDTSPCTHHIRHRHCRWLEAGAGPGGKGAAGYGGRADSRCRGPDGRARNGGSNSARRLRRTRRVTAGAPGPGHDRQQDKDAAAPHALTVPRDGSLEPGLAAGASVESHTTPRIRTAVDHPARSR
jgi:hypothetical protein